DLVRPADGGADPCPPAAAGADRGADGAARRARTTRGGGVMAAWRLARSLETLRDEIRSVYPGTTVWTIGDAAHVVSDHRPNAAGVVCAIDVKGDKGLDLAEFAEHLRRTNHRAVKYVIFNRRIWSKALNSQG